MFLLAKMTGLTRGSGVRTERGLRAEDSEGSQSSVPGRHRGHYLYRSVPTGIYDDELRTVLACDLLHLPGDARGCIHLQCYLHIAGFVVPVYGSYVVGGFHARAGGRGDTGKVGRELAQRPLLLGYRRPLAALLSLPGPISYQDALHYGGSGRTPLVGGLDMEARWVLQVADVEPHLGRRAAAPWAIDCGVELAGPQGRLGGSHPGAN